MSDKEIQQLIKQAEAELDASKSVVEIQAIEVGFLGKKGKLTQLMKQLKDLPNDEKRAFGQWVNQAKEVVSSKIAAKKTQCEQAELQAQIDAEVIDLSLPGRELGRGTLHPITIVTNRLVSILAGMGFNTVSGPEIEDDYHNFEALNFPSHHPARDMQDTFFLDNGLLLRTHTSSVQVRTLENSKPPIKIIAPGKAFRADEIDATHTPMFHQIEALAIDETAHFGDLKSVIYTLLKHYFNQEINIRFRPSYFPFTEPSAEVDLWHNGKWLEVMGCGMVHPNVLKASHIDPEQYQGYAFGMGIDRLAMLTFGVNDLRDLFSHDVEVLKQFTTEQWEVA